MRDAQCNRLFRNPQKESALLKQVQQQALARDMAHSTANNILGSTAGGTPWVKPPLFDIVYRIPDASLKLARDDRQAGLWYMQERKKAESGLTETKRKKQVRVREKRRGRERARADIEAKRKEGNIAARRASCWMDRPRPDRPTFNL